MQLPASLQLAANVATFIMSGWMAPTTLRREALSLVVAITRGGITVHMLIRLVINLCVTRPNLVTLAHHAAFLQTGLSQQLGVCRQTRQLHLQPGPLRICITSGHRTTVGAVVTVSAPLTRIAGTACTASIHRSPSRNRTPVKSLQGTRSTTELKGR